MTPLFKSPRIHLVLTTGICCLFLGGAALALGQEAQPEKARALLDQVKKSEQDRQIAIKQTDIERLKEDQEKTERDSEGLKKTIESTESLINSSSERLTTLTNESRRLEHELAVAQAQINAERLKIEGLRALTEAQAKSQSALARHAEEAAARSRVHTLEMEILEAGKLIPGEGREAESQAELTKARKALAQAEAKTESEERLAHDAMKAATSKMTLAETKATLAQRLAENDLTLEIPAVKAKPVAKTPEKAAEKPAPVAAGPKPAASTGAAAAKPATKPAATTTSKAPTSRPAAATR